MNGEKFIHFAYFGFNDNSQSIWFQNDPFFVFISYDVCEYKERRKSVKKVALVILILGLFFSVYPQQDSRSLTVMEMERIGDRLLATDELEQILSRAHPMPISVDIVYQENFYGVEQRGRSFVITDQQGDVHYYSHEPIRLLAGLEDEWLISRQTNGGQQLISFQPALVRETVIADLYGEELGDALVWEDKIYIESQSSHKGHVIYCYFPPWRDLSVFVANGFEPKLFDGRLYYVYRKGEASGIESTSADRTNVTSFAPQHSHVYSYFFRDGGIDLLTMIQQPESVHFLRIQDAFGSAEVEKFEPFDARFQSQRLVFGRNGVRDSLLLDNTLVQMPTDIHFRNLIDDWVYFVYQDQHYRLPVARLENILLSSGE